MQFSAKAVFAIAAVVGIAALPDTTGPRQEDASRDFTAAAQFQSPQGNIGTSILPIAFRGRIYAPLTLNGQAQVPVMLSDHSGDTTVVYAPLFDHHKPYGSNVINVYVRRSSSSCCKVDSVTVVPSPGGEPGMLHPPHFIYTA